MRPILRMLPEQVLAMPPEFCLRNNSTCHKLLMEGLQIPAQCTHQLPSLRAHYARANYIIEYETWRQYLSAARTAFLSSV